MSEMALSNQLPQAFNYENEQDKFIAISRTRNRWLTGFFISAVMGAAFGILGLILSGLEALVILQTSLTLDHVAVAMIVAAFPLMALAAHCLDKAADAKKEIKRISYIEKNK